MLLVFDDIRKYIGMNVVYFDGRNVYGVYIVSVEEKATKWSEGCGIRLDRRFIVACDKKSAAVFEAKEEKLFMNWNAWMRWILQKEHINLNLDDFAYRRDMITKVRLMLRGLCGDMYAMVKHPDLTSVDAFDRVVCHLYTNIRCLEQEIKKWKEEIKPKLVKDSEENWMSTLTRLMLKAQRKQASREARQQWRASHVVQ